MAEPYFETARSLIDYYLLINNLFNLSISLMSPHTEAWFLSYTPQVYNVLTIMELRPTILLIWQ